MMEDSLWWKTTYDGRQLMEDDSWWKTTYDGRRLMMEDDSWCKTTYDGRRQWGRPQKQRGLAHWWKAHGAGHIPLCGIFFSMDQKFTRNWLAPLSVKPIPSLIWFSMIFYGKHKKLFKSALIRSIFEQEEWSFFQWVRISPEINWYHYQNASLAITCIVRHQKLIKVKCHIRAWSAPPPGSLCDT